MAFSVALKAKGTMVPVAKNDPSWTNWPTKIPYKWAHLVVTQDTTQYATGGLALDVLGQLSDWTKITGESAAVFTNNSVNTTARLIARNDGTAGNRKVQLVVCSTGAEVANAVASTSTTWDLWVTGY